MTKSFILPLTMAMCIAAAPAAFAQGMMAPQGSNMSNTSSDKMNKPADAMSKTDGMKKDQKTDGMKKTDDMSKDGMKKDGMSK